MPVPLKSALIKEMSQASNLKHVKEAGTSQNRTAILIQSFRSKLAQRKFASTPPKMYEDETAFVLESSKPGDAEQSRASTVAEDGRSHALHTNGHYGNLDDHLRCTECHNLGQLVGEARLAGIALAQRQNDAVHGLKMLIMEASAALETVLDSQDQLDRTHRDADERLVHLTRCCPGCIILSSGLTRPVEAAADLIDETQLRQRLADMSDGVVAVREGTTSDAMSSTTLETIDNWVGKVKQAADSVAMQRSRAQSRLSTLEAAVEQRQSPFKPVTAQPVEKLSRSRSLDMSMIRRESSWSGQGQEASSTAIKSQETGLVTKGKGKVLGGKQVRAMPSDFREPPPNWPGLR